MAKANPQAEPGIDLDTLYDVLDFKPHSDAQWEYCRSTARFNIPCCGRRWGKSISAGHRMTYKAFVPNSYNWIVGPTYKLGEKEFRVVWDDFKKLGILGHPSTRKQYAVNQGNMRIQLPWGAVVEVVSAEKPDGLLGEGLSHVIMSEAAKHSRDTWEQYIEPALSDLLGTADFPSTPQGYNWYHGLWLMGQGDFANAAPATSKLASVPSDQEQILRSSGEGPHNYKSWSFPTWTNPVRYPGGYDDPEIVRLRNNTSKIYFEQEYGAMFTSLTGAIYDEWDQLVHIQEHTFNPSWQNFLAFDYGYANPFVALDIQLSPSDEVFVWREYYSRHISTYEHGLILKQRDNPPGYHIDGMWGDHRGPDEAATLSNLLGHVSSMDVPWKLGVEMIKQLMKPNQFGKVRLHVDPSCTNLTRQLAQLHVKNTVRYAQDLNEMTGDGNIQHKVDDHAADALRYLIGPLFVMGMNSHLEDVYGAQYRGSESEDFLRVRQSMVLDTSITL